MKFIFKILIVKHRYFDYFSHDSSYISIITVWEFNVLLWRHSSSRPKGGDNNNASLLDPSWPGRIGRIAIFYPLLKKFRFFYLYPEKCTPQKRFRGNTKGKTTPIYSPFLLRLFSPKKFLGTTFFWIKIKKSEFF